MRGRYRARSRIGRCKGNPAARPPPIRLARNGWTLSPRFATMVALVGGSGLLDAATARRFQAPDGKPLPAGTRLRNPEQAALLERIAKAGPEAFYAGEGPRIVATV